MVLNGKVYDFTKRVAQIYLPALGTLYFALAGIWHLPAADQIVGSVVALDTALGVMLGISSTSYNASAAKYDGEFAIVEGEDASTLRLTDVNVKSLDSKNELLFKLNRPTP